MVYMLNFIVSPTDPYLFLRHIGRYVVFIVISYGRKMKQMSDHDWVTIKDIVIQLERDLKGVGNRENCSKLY